MVSQDEETVMIANAPVQMNEWETLFALRTGRVDPPPPNAEWGAPEHSMLEGLAGGPSRTNDALPRRPGFCEAGVEPDPSEYWRKRADAERELRLLSKVNQVFRRLGYPDPQVEWKAQASAREVSERDRRLVRFLRDWGGSWSVDVAPRPPTPVPREPEPAFDCCEGLRRRMDCCGF
jgi:hypothetical protein